MIKKTTDKEKNCRAVQASRWSPPRLVQKSRFCENKKGDGHVDNKGVGKVLGGEGERFTDLEFCWRDTQGLSGRQTDRDSGCHLGALEKESRD